LAPSLPEPTGAGRATALVEAEVATLPADPQEEEVEVSVRIFIFQNLYVRQLIQGQ
jgi:hypothetical protein